MTLLLFALMRLLNFCIDKRIGHIMAIDWKDDVNCICQAEKVNASPAQLDANGCPRDLIGGGHHFNDLKQKELEHGNSDTPMDGMLALVRSNRLLLPA